MEEARWRRYAGRSMREAARRLVARTLEAHEALLEDVWRLAGVHAAGEVGDAVLAGSAATHDDASSVSLR